MIAMCRPGYQRKRCDGAARRCFQGLEKEGLKLLAKAKTEFGTPVITEVMDTCDVGLLAEYVDIL